MIAFLSGIVQAKAENFLILNVNGVGYQVFTTQDILLQTREKKPLELFTLTIVREQEISLYGFASMHDRQFFELLISVSGIGPKTALEFFQAPIPTIKDAISTGDVAFLTKVKGVGKKTAERVVMELKGKMGSVFVVENIVMTSESDANDEATKDVILALEGLGYDRMTIVKQLQKAPQFATSEEAVFWFLQNQ